MQTKILYEDREFIVCHKPAGLPTQTSNIRVRDLTDELREYLIIQQRQNQLKVQGTVSENRKPFLGLINRLDQPVEGIVVVAKTEDSAANLSRQMQQSKMSKRYLAVLAYESNLPDKGKLEDYLIEDKAANLSIITNANHPKAKRAELFYEIIEHRESIALARITLKTGRHHQIRLQFSNQGAPLLGDLKYGDQKSKKISLEYAVKNIALCAYEVKFLHPKTGEYVTYTIKPSSDIYQIFKSL